MSDRKIAVLFALAVAFQVFVLAAIPARRVWVLATGRTFRMEIMPVDPYSVLSGYYADLGYDINSLSAFPNPPSLEPGETVYAILEEDSGGSWKPVELKLTFPTDLAPDRIALKGTAEGSWTVTNIEYGIETFFVPESQRHEVEAGLRRGAAKGEVEPGTAEIKVDRWGNAAIVSIRVAGRTYD